MTGDVQRDLGRMEAQIAAIDDRGKAMAKDLAFIKVTLAEAKGGWKMLLVVGSVAGIAGGLLVKIVPYLRLGG